jgi:hypothetical protein
MSSPSQRCIFDFLVYCTATYLPYSQLARPVLTLLHSNAIDVSFASSPSQRCIFDYAIDVSFASSPFQRCIFDFLVHCTATRLTYLPYSQLARPVMTLSIFLDFLLMYINTTTRSCGNKCVNRLLNNK